MKRHGTEQRPIAIRMVQKSFISGLFQKKYRPVTSCVTGRNPRAEDGT